LAAGRNPAVTRQWLSGKQNRRRRGKQWEATPAYQDDAGYQPLLALQAGMNLVVADELRDADVPALRKRCSKRAIGSVKNSV